jgi:hypothetical protein
MRIVELNSIATREQQYGNPSYCPPDGMIVPCLDELGGFQIAHYCPGAGLNGSKLTWPHIPETVMVAFCPTCGVVYRLVNQIAPLNLSNEEKEALAHLNVALLTIGILAGAAFFRGSIRRFYRANAPQKETPASKLLRMIAETGAVPATD